MLQGHKIGVHHQNLYGLLRPACLGYWEISQYCEMKLVKVTKMGEQLNAGNSLESENDSR